MSRLRIAADCPKCGQECATAPLASCHCPSTAAALKASRALFMHKDVAAIIDREAGLPQLIAACKLYLAHCEGGPLGSSTLYALMQSALKAAGEPTEGASA